jgi:hypothetical protein
MFWWLEIAAADLYCLLNFAKMPDYTKEANTAILQVEA